MSLRNKEQIMGFWLNEPVLRDPERIRRGIRDLAQEGYGIVRLIHRNSNYTHRCPEMVHAVAVAVETAHQVGMRVVFDAEPHPMVAQDMGGQFPEAIGNRLVKVETRLLSGYFKLHVPCPSGTLVFNRVENAFLEIDGDITPLDNFEYELVWEVAAADNGHTVDRQDYVPGGSTARRRHVQLSGRLADHPQGRLVVYVNFHDTTLIDFASDGCQAYYRDLLNQYQDVPLDGVFWDEPAVGGDWSNYRYGDAFAEAFAKRNGYRLKDRLYLLDSGQLTPEASAVRLDYYRTLNESLFDAQKDFYEHAEQLFGKTLIRGTHHTWQGEGGANDYRAGAVDYFRLNDLMDAGYTDCCWWDQKSVSYSYILGSSLGRLSPSGECECNTWHWKPTNAQVLYNTRLMSLMNITWFNIWYGNYADTCMYPAHYTWKTTVASMRRHRENQLGLGQAKPVVDIAVLHDWKSIAGINDECVASLHKAFCLNLSKAAIDNNLAFDFVDDRLLGSARIEDGRLCCDLGNYSTLVLPFATLIDDASWHVITDFIKADGKVIFCGPPPELTASGQAIGAEFATLLGIDAIPLARYRAWFAESCTSLPKGRPDRFDPAFPVTSQNDNVLVSIEDQPCGARNAAGNCLYFSGFEASEAVLRQLRIWTNPGVRCHSGSILFREYQDANRRRLMLVARDGKELSGIVEFAGFALLFEGGDSACLSVDKAGELSVTGPEVKFRKLKIES
jgi:hypothetical protein